MEGVFRIKLLFFLETILVVLILRILELQSEIEYESDPWIFFRHNLNDLEVKKVANGFHK